MRKSRLIQLQQIDGLKKSLEFKGQSIVFTNGCFDIIHAGHIHLLKQASQFGDILIVGLNSDDSIKRLKGIARPINILEDRIAVLESIRFVDFIIVFEEDTPIKLIEAILPNVLVKGADYVKTEVVGYDLVVGNGGAVECVPLLEGRSSSLLIEKSKNS